MAYVHCIPVRVVDVDHALDNVVSGTLETDDGRTLAFRTRGHVVKATNKIYRDVPWKPTPGARVLVDGDLTGDDIVVDHVEPDQAGDAIPDATHPHLDAIAAMLPRHPVASKTLRVARGGGTTRLRFVDLASRRDARGRVAEEVVHAAFDANGWRVWSVTKRGGRVGATRLDEALIVILARACGRELLAGETAVEVDRREQAELRAERERVTPPPDDDVPF